MAEDGVEVVEKTIAELILLFLICNGYLYETEKGYLKPA